MGLLTLDILKAFLDDEAKNATLISSCLVWFSF